MWASRKKRDLLSPEEQLYRARVLRLAVGIGLSTAAAFGLAWSLSFLTPMLAASFLATPAPRPKVLALLSFPVMIFGALCLALLVASIGLSSPILALLSIMLMVFQCFYLLTQGVARGFTTWALIGILMIPVMASQSLSLAMDLTLGIFTSGLVAMAFVWLAHALVPDPAAGPSAPQAPAAAATPDIDKLKAAKGAFVRTLVILPLEAYVLIGQNTGDLKLLIFAAMLAQSPNLQAGAKGGKAMIMGNAFGGVVAMAFYELLVLCPSYLFLLLLFVLLALVFGRQIFGGGKMAPLCSAGLGTIILLIGMGTMPYGDEVDTAFYSRILQVIMASIYIVLAFRVVDEITMWRIKRKLLA